MRGTPRLLGNPFSGLLVCPFALSRAALMYTARDVEPPLPACICVAAGAQVDGIEASIAPRDRGDLVGQRHTFDAGGDGLD